MLKRPIRIDGDVAYVTLTKGYLAMIDTADTHFVAGWNWRALVDGNTVYAVRKDCSGPKQRSVKMHRIIMGNPEGLEIDHKDGDGLNNRRNNLREATRSQNNHNQRRSKNNTSGFKGVTWHKAGGKWQAQIMMDGRKRFLGLHATPEAAHTAYCKASAELHGEYGRVA